MLSSVLIVHMDAVEARLATVSKTAARAFREQPNLWLETLREYHGETRRFIIRRAYANLDRLTLNVRKAWIAAGFELIDCMNEPNMRSSAEVRVTIDVLDCLDAKRSFEEIVLLVGNTDFSPLLHRIRASLMHSAVMVDQTTQVAVAALAETRIDMKSFAKHLDDQIGKKTENASVIYAASPKPAFEQAVETQEKPQPLWADQTSSEHEKKDNKPEENETAKTQTDVEASLPQEQEISLDAKDDSTATKAHETEKAATPAIIETELTENEAVENKQEEAPEVASSIKEMAQVSDAIEEQESPEIIVESEDKIEEPQSTIAEDLPKVEETPKVEAEKDDTDTSFINLEALEEEIALTKQEDVPESNDVASENEDFDFSKIKSKTTQEAEQKATEEDTKAEAESTKAESSKPKKITEVANTNTSPTAEERAEPVLEEPEQTEEAKDETPKKSDIDREVDELLARLLSEDLHDDIQTDDSEQEARFGSFFGNLARKR
jgi:hypothetical protein